MPLFHYTVDEQIADLIAMMNYHGIRTINSCQDNRYNRGTVPRVWVQILAEHFVHFLSAIDQPDEVDDIDSLSNRIVPARYPDSSGEPWDRLDFEDNRAWHYIHQVQRHEGTISPLAMSIRFPATDLPEVVTRLCAAAKELDGRVMPGSENNDQPEDTPQG